MTSTFEVGSWFHFIPKCWRSCKRFTVPYMDITYLKLVCSIKNGSILSKLSEEFVYKNVPQRYTASLAVPIWGAYSADLCEAAIMSADSPSGMGSR